ncbi:MAG: hypothetical protein HeimC3_00560 [Candidatus Heimdallarchaeota archaeon LC_3]|nr:MAG: hypothetical protein HeimC3_00560 [Candidatus Heimdallarchaeota archaeon LC_3]
MTELFKQQLHTDKIKDNHSKENLNFQNDYISIKKKSNYKRFQIKISPAPAKKGLPHPFYPKIQKIGLFKLLIKELLEINFKLVRKKYRNRLLARPCIYGVFSGKLGGFHPIRSKCVGCLRCVQEYPDFCTVERNPKFLNFADSYWAPDSNSKLASLSTAFSTVWYEAESGKILIKGMGYKGSFSDIGWDTIWTDMSEIVRPTRDGVYGREFISTIVNIGRKNILVNILEKIEIPSNKQISLPIIFDYLPDNINNENIAQSIFKTTTEIQTACFFTPEQIKKYSINYLNNTSLGIYINKKLDSKSIKILEHASIIELDYNIKMDISEIKKINHKAPIILKIPVKKDIEDLICSLAKDGVDGFHLYADYHGQSFDKEKPKFIIEYIRLIHTKLVEIGVRNQLTIIVSGGIISAEHVPKAIICGADLVAIDTTILVALQTKFFADFSNSQSGNLIQNKFDSKWGSQRLTNLLASWYNQLIEVLSAMGIRDIRRLRGEVGRAIFKIDVEKEAFDGIEGFLESQQ